jgi:predicted nucleic acid-binding protein
MRAVSDTSPISALASIGQLSLLKSQFSEIWIPTAVSDELKLHPDTVALASIETAIREKRIRLASPSTAHLLSILSLHLHRGEAEAIALAIDIKADFVLIDEQEGRGFAVQTGLSVIGVLGILLRAKLNGEIPALKPEILSLRAKARFFIASSLEARILSAAGE